MTHLLHSPRLLRKYIDRKKEQLRETLEELEDLPLDDRGRLRLLERKLYLEKGVPELEEVYAEISEVAGEGSPNRDQSLESVSEAKEPLSSPIPVGMTEKADHEVSGRVIGEVLSRLDAILAHLSETAPSESPSALPASPTDHSYSGMTKSADQSQDAQFIAQWDQLSKGVREGRTVDLLYVGLRKMRSLFREKGLTASLIRKGTEQELSVVWEWIDRISDPERTSGFLDLIEWEEGARFIFLQIATLYEYDPHLKKKPSWSTVRDWRKAYLGHMRHHTPNGRRPQ